MQETKFPHKEPINNMSALVNAVYINMLLDTASAA